MLGTKFQVDPCYPLSKDRFKWSFQTFTIQNWYTLWRPHIKYRSPWLRRVAAFYTLQNFLRLTVKFLHDRSVLPPQLKDSGLWLNLAALTDLTAKLSKLNIALQFGNKEINKIICYRWLIRSKSEAVEGSVDERSAKPLAACSKSRCSYDCVR